MLRCQINNKISNRFASPAACRFAIPRANPAFPAFPTSNSIIARTNPVVVKGSVFATPFCGTQGSNRSFGQDCCEHPQKTSSTIKRAATSATGSSTAEASTVIAATNAATAIADATANV